MSEKEKVAEDITVREEDEGSRRWTTTRVELWAFYVYYIVSTGIIVAITQVHTDHDRNAQGNNGLSGFNFGPSQFQNLLFLAGYDPSQPPFTAPCGADTDCVLPYLGRVRDGAVCPCLEPATLC